jgi:regulator of protease activity HflC (stomatin/prohibitin superfamily)
MSGSNKSSEGGLSRREFARGVALAAATVGVPLTARGEIDSPSSTPTQEASAQASQLSAAGEAQVQTILAKYGKRLSEEQKADIRRLVAQAQKTSEALRSFPLDNSDEPAMIFHVYRQNR